MDDIIPATHRMTYAEVGEAPGILPKSAEPLAQRRRWPRQIGNDGMARVLLPIGKDRVTPDVRGHHRAPMSPSVGGHRHPDIGDVIRAAIRDVVTRCRLRLSTSGHAPTGPNSVRTRRSPLSVEQSVRREPLIPAFAPLDFVPRPTPG